MGKNDFEISFRNCRNISSSGNDPLIIKKNALNVYYGKNGVGKTTICRVLSYLADKSEENEAALQSFAYRESGDANEKPTASCSSTIKTIRVFNDEWIQNHCFEKSNLQRNAFELYIRNKQTKKLERQRNQIIRGIQRALESPEVGFLRYLLEAVSKGIGKVKTNGSLTAAAPAIKAFQHGVPIEPIPMNLKNVTAGMTASEKSIWLRWHIEAPQISNQAICPYCGTNNHHALSLCRNYDNSRNKQEINKWANLADFFENYGDALSRGNRALLKRVLSSKTAPNAAEERKLSDLAQQASNVAAAINDMEAALKDESCFEPSNLIGRLNKNSSVVSGCSAFLKTSNGKHTDAGKALSTITKSISRLSRIQAQLGIVAKELRNQMAASVSGHESEFNAFLKQCGYSYSIKIQLNRQTSDASLFLLPNSSLTEVEEAGDALSYGERNALALVLFMFEAIHDKPSLIVLDDPISSFDYDKRYGVLYALFSTDSNVFSENLSRKTALVLTHDFLVISDLIGMPGKNIPSTKGNYITADKKGSFQIIPMEKDAILPYTQQLKKMISSAEYKPEIIKLVYIRKLCELLRPNATEKRSKEGWTFRLLSDVVHGRTEKATMAKHRFTSKKSAGVKMCENYVRKLTKCPFDFWKAIDHYSDCVSDLIQYYEKDASSSLEKLLLVRLILEREPQLGADSYIMKRFADESCHIGGSYLFQLDGNTFDQVPFYVIDWCDDIVNRAKSASSVNSGMMTT